MLDLLFKILEQFVMHVLEMQEKDTFFFSAYQLQSNTLISAVTFLNTFSLPERDDF